MADLTLKVSHRDVTGKKSRFIRRQGFTPAHLFGRNLESLALQANTTELEQIIPQARTTRLIDLVIEKDKKPKSVFIREIQRNPLTRQLLHVDFYQVTKGERIACVVPIALVGEAPAMKGKGRILIHGITSLNCECLPEKVPQQIEVDLSPLVDTEKTLFVKDIVLDPDIKVNNDPDQLVVKVGEVAAEKEVVVEKVAEEVAPAAEAGTGAAAEAGAEKAKAEKAGPEKKA